MTAGGQDEEVHPLPRQRATVLPSRPTSQLSGRVEVQEYLRDQCRNVERFVLVPRRVSVEDHLLDLVVVQGGSQAIVQIQADFPWWHVVGKTLPSAPPLDELALRQAIGRDRPVEDQTELPVAHDLDIVVDGISEHQLGFGTVRREDQVLGRGADPSPAVVLSKQRRQIIQKPASDIELGDHPARKGHEAGKFPARGVPLDDVAFRVLVVRWLVVRLQLWQLEFFDEYGLKLLPGVTVDERFFHRTPEGA